MGGGFPRGATASVTRSSTSRYSVASVTDRGARWHRRVPSGRAGPRRTRGLVVLDADVLAHGVSSHFLHGDALLGRDGGAVPALQPRGGGSWPPEEGFPRATSSSGRADWVIMVPWTYGSATRASRQRRIVRDRIRDRQAARARRRTGHDLCPEPRRSAPCRRRP
jgi:hypothetical protein